MFISGKWKSVRIFFQSTPNSMLCSVTCLQFNNGLSRTFLIFVVLRGSFLQQWNSSLFAWLAMTARTWIVDFSRRSQPLQMMVNPLNVQTLWLNQMMIQWSQEASPPCLFLQHYFWWIWSNTNTPLEVCISHIPLYPWISNLQCKPLHSMYFWTYKKWSFRLYLVHHPLT